MPHHPTTLSNEFEWGNSVADEYFSPAVKGDAKKCKIVRRYRLRYLTRLSESGE